MLTYGFFNSLNGDRTYNAEQMAYIIDALVNDGVMQNYGEFFSVTPGDGMTVVVNKGMAWFDSTWTRNDGQLVLDIASADVTLTRYDAVVLEVDRTNTVRANSVKVIQGTPSSSPVKPAMVKSTNVNQYPLAYVKVEPGVTAIPSSAIEIRVGQSDCPWITGILSTVNIDVLFAQWNGEFTEWFNNLKAMLNDNVVANLQSQIDTLNASVGALGVTKADKSEVEEAAKTVLNVVNDKKYILDNSPTSGVLFGNHLYDSNSSFGPFWVMGDYNGDLMTVYASSSTAYFRIIKPETGASIRNFSFTTTTTDIIPVCVRINENKPYVTVTLPSSYQYGGLLNVDTGKFVATFGGDSNGSKPRCYGINETYYGRVQQNGANLMIYDKNNSSTTILNNLSSYLGEMPWVIDTIDPSYIILCVATSSECIKIIKYNCATKTVIDSRSITNPSYPTELNSQILDVKKDQNYYYFLYSTVASTSSVPSKLCIAKMNRNTMAVEQSKYILGSTGAEYYGSTNEYLYYYKSDNKMCIRVSKNDLSFITKTITDLPMFYTSGTSSGGLWSTMNKMMLYETISENERMLYVPCKDCVIDFQKATKRQCSSYPTFVGGQGYLIGRPEYILWNLPLKDIGARPFGISPYSTTSRKIYSLSKPSQLFITAKEA